MMSAFNFTTLQQIILCPPNGREVVPYSQMHETTNLNLNFDPREKRLPPDRILGGFSDVFNLQNKTHKKKIEMCPYDTDDLPSALRWWLV